MLRHMRRIRHLRQQLPCVNTYSTRIRSFPSIKPSATICC
ncbi:hypothetical protein PHM2_055 [Prochlorococcus phage P-HM2]|uniref:Uncharacterized protein n=1 Tax=Prochlorococcus phage P-HM2 TaxID=445696 RepID=E3SSQ5_9CAUD|nr:hypothetical protein PHM2_055 [Prochlorococcus phage P-HM2]ADO99833.1 hypothetical protein PHM2_055 [Prochlorococcus phage P-HM2]